MLGGSGRCTRILDEHEPRAIRVYSRDELKQSELQKTIAQTGGNLLGVDAALASTSDAGVSRRSRSVAPRHSLACGAVLGGASMVGPAQNAPSSVRCT